MKAGYGKPALSATDGYDASSDPLRYRYFTAWATFP